MRASEDQLRSWMVSGLGGNAADHAALLRALLPLLHAFYRRRMRGQEDAIQAPVQETLTAVHHRRGTYDRERAFSGWLYAIARYKMIDQFRRSGRLCPIEDIDDIVVAEGFEDAAGASLDVERLLETLPAKQARAIRATRIEGLSVAETAERDKIGLSDVKVSVHRGLRALAQRIRSDFG